MNVRERPILFSGPMIRALLAGKKTQTRRVVTAGNSTVLGYGVTASSPMWSRLLLDKARVCRCMGPEDVHLEAPYVWPEGGFPESAGCAYRVRPKTLFPGYSLWVKETWREPGSLMRSDGKAPPSLYRDDVVWKADDETQDGPWRSPLFLPRRLSRLTLEVEAVRVERLHEISPLDAIAEGIFNEGERSAVEAPLPYPVATYKRLWDSINGKRAPWSSNPWVWVVTFKVVTGRATPLDARDARDK